MASVLSLPQSKTDVPNLVEFVQVFIVCCKYLIKCEELISDLKIFLLFYVIVVNYVILWQKFGACDFVCSQFDTKQCNGEIKYSSKIRESTVFWIINKNLCSVVSCGSLKSILRCFADNWCYDFKHLMNS